MIDDEYETPYELYQDICNLWGVRPDLDIAANKDNKKCHKFLTDAFNQPWDSTAAVWCNPPHSMTKDFVKLCHDYWVRTGMPVVMLIPANSVCTKYAEKYIKKKAIIEPIYGRPRFLKDGKPSKFPSRNSYFTVFYP